MKYRYWNKQSPVCILLVLVVAFGFLGVAVSQDEETREFASFTIVVKTVDNQIKLVCKDGCSWDELAFSDPIAGGSQAVDQFGMTTLDQDGVEEASEEAGFLFTIARADSGISLQGIRGSAWTQLTFGCPRRGCNQAINDYGMASPFSH